LRAALDLRSLYVFPFTIVKAHFEHSHKRTNPYHDTFVQLCESRAKAIYDGDRSAWSNLGLRKSSYRFISPHEKLHLVTREGYLEKEIIKSVNRLAL
jgi:hypothetical protein